MNLIKGAGSVFLIAVGITVAAKGGKYLLETISEGLGEAKEAPRLIIVRKEIIENAAEAVKEAAENVQEATEAVQS